MPQIMQGSKKEEEQQESKIDTLNKLMSIGMNVAGMMPGPVQTAEQGMALADSVKKGERLDSAAQKAMYSPINRRLEKLKMFGG